MHMKDYEFWFLVGSQLLYGPEVFGNGIPPAQKK